MSKNDADEAVSVVSLTSSSGGYINGMDHGYKNIRLIRSLKKVIFRYQDLVEIYTVSAVKIIVVKTAPNSVK
jgi:hypothetical protein